MLDLFAELTAVCRAQPATVLSYSRTGHIHYGAFGRIVDLIARHAMAQGIKPGDMVALRVAQPEMRLQLAVGLMRLGCRVGIIQDLDAYQAQGVSIDVLLTDASPNAPKAPQGQRTMVLTPAWLQPDRVSARPLPDRSPFSLLFGSSGSTGRTKLIEMSETAFVRRLEAKIGDGYFGNQPRFLSTAGETTTTTMQDSFITILKGGTIFRPPGRSGPELLDAVQIHKPDYAVMTPASLVEMLRILAETPAQIDKIGTIRLVGAYCSADTQRLALAKVAERIVFSYGATEIGRIAWGYFDEIEKVERSVGRIRDHVEIATVDSSGKPLPRGAEGELRIKVPPGVACTYPGTNASGIRTFDGDWFIPGDFGRVDADGNLIIIGRASTIINMGGTKVSPEALEEAAVQYASVRDIGVAGVEGVDGFQRVYAAIVSRGPVDLHRLNAYLNRKDPRFGIHAITPVEAIPRTASGKIDRVALRAIFAA